MPSRFPDRTGDIRAGVADDRGFILRLLSGRCHCLAREHRFPDHLAGGLDGVICQPVKPMTGVLPRTAAKKRRHKGIGAQHQAEEDEFQGIFQEPGSQRSGCGQKSCKGPV